MSRILGVDYGERRLGFALSDEAAIIASPLRVVELHSPSDAVTEVRRVCDEVKASTIVVGLPLNMNGSFGPQAERVLAFVRDLRAAIPIRIETKDERLSSRQAERMLVDAGASRAKRKSMLDKLAAQMVLQSYLDSRAGPADDPGLDAAGAIP